MDNRAANDAIKKWFEEEDARKQDLRLNEATVDELSAAYYFLDAQVDQATPQLEAMMNTLNEATILLDTLRKRRGKVAYWLSLRKAQR